MSIIHSKLTKLNEGQDKLIDKLDIKLEKKFPKLSSFLKIRLKFQKYYLI